MTLLFVCAVIVMHFVADFICQSDWMAINKSKSMDALFVHGATYGLVMIVLMLALTTTVSVHQVTTYYLVNVFAHIAQDAVTSRITSRLWFIELHRRPEFVMNIPVPNGTTYRAYPWFASVKDGYRHWFFVVIGADQMLHYLTLFITADWLLAP